MLNRLPLSGEPRQGFRQSVLEADPGLEAEGFASFGHIRERMPDVSGPELPVNRLREWLTGILLGENLTNVPDQIIQVDLFPQADVECLAGN